VNGISSIALARPSLVVGAKEIAEAWGRMPRGIEHVRVPAWDEDGTTLAIDAAKEALGRESGSALRVILASGVDAAILAEALGAHHARVLSVAGGIEALEAALRLVDAPALCVVSVVPASAPGSDARIEEAAGAAAFLVTADGPLQLITSSTYVRAASPRGELDADEPTRLASERFVLPADAPLFVAGPAALARVKSVRPAVDARKEWGALGVLAPLVQLFESLRQGAPKGGWCVVGDASAERATFLALKVEGAGLVLTPPPERARRVSPTRALAESRELSQEPDSTMGAYVPAGTWVEDLPARLRLVAQQCESCRRVMYPPRATCPDCRGRAFAGLTLPPTAIVYAATRIGRGGAPSEFAGEQTQTGAFWVGVVEWPEQRVRVTTRLIGYDEHGPNIGDPVRAVVRRLFEQEGAVRYGVKFGPV